MNQLDLGEGQVKGLYEALRRTLGEPGEWQWLFTPDGKQLINTNVGRLNLEGRYENPTLNEPDKPCSAFAREGASIPVLHDWEIMQVFVEQGCLDAFPRFLRAGEQPEYRFDPTNVKVGILIAGGIAAGLNMCVDSIVKRHFALATQIAGEEPQSLRIYSYDGGYEGMMRNRRCLLAPTDGAARRAGYYDELPELKQTSWVKEKLIRATDPLAADEGSTLLKAGRGKEEIEEDAIRARAREHAGKIVAEGLDILYVIGGNGTLSWAARIYEALEEMPKPRPIAIVGGPKTMDNDVFFTDTTFGFRTAVDQATRFTLAMHAEAESQDRLSVLEVFGAHCGWVAMLGYYLSGEGDVMLIPELVPGDREAYNQELEEALDYVEQRVDANGHALAIIAEGAMPEFRFHDAGSRDEAFTNLLRRIRQRFGKDREQKGKEPVSISAVSSRYLVRATEPNTYDLELCKVTGKLMVDTALAGFTGCAVHRWQNDYVVVPFRTATERRKEAPVWKFIVQEFLDKRRIQRLKAASLPPIGP